MINSSFDLTTVEPFDWPYPPGLIVPLKPLTKEQEALFPWNFEWTFSWLKDPLRRETDIASPQRTEMGPFEKRHFETKYREALRREQHQQQQTQLLQPQQQRAKPTP